MMAPAVSVVIVNYNRREDLCKALESIATQDHTDHEVIVVDNASSDRSGEMVRAEFPNVRLITLDENVGMAGYNRGFDAARGDIVFQMDNDSLMPDANVLSSMIGIFRTAPLDVGVVAARVEEWRPEDSVDLLRGRDGRTGPLEDIGFHSGGVAFRKSVLERTSGYNRDVFLYGAELFLQAQVLQLGYRILFCPELLMLHRSSPKERDRNRGIYYEIRNRIWFVRAWGSAYQRISLLPRIIFHDVLYGLFRHAIKVTLKAFRDGLGSLPAGIRPDGNERPGTVRDMVAGIGNGFRVGRTFGRVVGRLRGREDR